jgi:hypothetical protein
MEFLGSPPRFISWCAAEGIFAYSIGPVDLTEGTVTNVDTVPTVVDNLHRQGTITNSILGVYFEPSTQASKPNAGSLSFGDADTSLTTGEITYVPITRTSPASNYWGIDQAITYGSTNILSGTAGIVDTGKFSARRSIS